MARIDAPQTVEPPSPRPAASPGAPTARWSPDLDPLSIHVSSAKSVPAGSFGEASRSSVRRLGASGTLASFCETPAQYPLQVRFYVDAEGLPRPAPFTPPSVSASLAFTPDGRGAPTDERKVADARPTYAGPGRWLRTSFGDVVSMSAPGSGTLGVVARLADPDARTTVDYTDEIPCRLEPCA